MRRWPSTKARRVLAALLRLGWRIKREVFAFHTPPPSARVRQSEILRALYVINRLPS